LGSQDAVPILATLSRLGHKQPPLSTLVETNNSTAHDILTAQVILKHSKAFDVRYKLIKDRIAQGQSTCLRHFTKHHHPPVVY